MDGLARPGGETEAALAAAASGSAGQSPSLQQASATNSSGEASRIQLARGHADDFPPDIQAKLAPVYADPLFWRFVNNTKKREGLYIDDPTDRGGPTQRGISQKLLNLLHEKYKDWQLPDHTKNLSDKEIDAIYALEFYAHPRLHRFADVFGDDELGLFLAEQVFDAGVLHDPVDAGKFLQKALDDVLGTDLRERNRSGNLVHDGIIGPKTLDAVRRAFNEDKIDLVQSRVANFREAHMRKVVEDDPLQKDKLGGWLSRARSFSVSTHPGMSLHRNLPLK